MLNRIVALSLALTVTGGIAASAADKTPVTVYMYSEYIAPEIAAEFEKATGYPLKVEVYEAQEDMLAKLRAGATNQYDVVVATDAIIPQMIKLKLVQPLDNSLIPNSAGVDVRLKSPVYDPKNEYSWPYFWGTVGIVWDTTKTPKDAKPTWKWLFDAKSEIGPFVLMDEQRTMLGCTNKFLGFDMNTRDPKQIQGAVDALITAKGSKNCLGFDGGVGGLNKVVAGQAVAAVVYNGDAARSIAEKPTLAYAIPAEGSNIWVDNLLLTKDAPNKAGAHAFINYILAPAVAAQNANSMRYATPVATAMDQITPEDRTNTAIYPTPEAVKTLSGLEDLGKDTRLYNEAWTAVKSR